MRRRVASSVLIQSLKSRYYSTLGTMSRLSRFEESMESVYGKFSDIGDASTWVPPPGSGGHRGRYLWTDAFGVLNFLTLHKESHASNSRYLTLADRLVKNVHDVLGRTRDGRSRLPGATDKEPLQGGLRIGKVSDTGSDGDGQYHHYLTVWMFALNRLSMATNDPSYNRQAVSLAKAIHPHFFIDRTSAYPRMVWKVTMDLARPLVKSEGNLDPIDGFMVFRLLQSSARKYGDGEVLEEEIRDYQKVMARKGKHFVSSDPLDLGMTLWTAHWLAGRETWATDLRENCVSRLRKYDHPCCYAQITPEVPQPPSKMKRYRLIASLICCVSKGTFLASIDTSKHQCVSASHSGNSERVWE